MQRNPTIDVLVTVADPDDESGYLPALEARGYQLRVREAEHRMFRTATCDVHVHVWADSNPEVEHYLRFRDRLRGSSEDSVAYERLKRELATREWADMNDYANAKGALISEILDRAGP